MCGLVGIWRHDGGGADPADVNRMLAPIAHRGPDGRGVWQDGRVALGHLRLSIIDLTEASGQPMLTADGMGALVYNGEVYNYRELRKELEREGLQFRSSGDVEVVLHALHHWGVEPSVRRFNGMFAFAYVDRRDGTLWLARDRVGIKPMLVADTGSELLFASEAKALLAHPRMKARVDRHAMATWILLIRRGSERMLLEGLDRVAPGSLWKITERGIEKRRYFHVLDALDVDRLSRASTSDPRSFIDPFRELFDQSVRLHLASDVKLASACSGGVDSSLIAAYAKEQLPDITGYVADLVPWVKGEGAQAKRVGQHLGIPVHRVEVDQARFLELWPHAVWHSDSPPTSPSDAALLAVALKCRADGIKVLLTGEGADELFGGYQWLGATYKEWSSRDFWPGHILGDRKRWKALAHAPFSTMPARTDRQLRDRMIFAFDADDELLPQRFLDLLAPIKPDADRTFLAHGFCSLYHHLSWILHRHDRIGMAASIEMRVPFLENEIFDFAFHLPRRAKLHKGVGKWVVKQVAAEILPADIVYARKKGFPMPLHFSRGTEQLLVGGMLAELLEWPANTTQDIVAVLGNRELLRFHVVSLELWARMFLGGEAPAALAAELAAFAYDVAPLGKNPNKRKRTHMGALTKLTRRAWRRVGQRRVKAKASH